MADEGDGALEDSAARVRDMFVRLLLPRSSEASWRSVEGAWARATAKWNEECNIPKDLPSAAKDVGRSIGETLGHEDAETAGEAIYNLLEETIHPLRPCRRLRNCHRMVACLLNSGPLCT